MGPPAAALSPETVVVVTERQVSCDLWGDAAVLHTESGLYYTLEGVGARIWQLVQTPRRVADIRDAVVAEFAVDPARGEADLLRLLADLAAADLVRAADAPPG